MYPWPWKREKRDVTSGSMRMGMEIEWDNRDKKVVNEKEMNWLIRVSAGRRFRRSVSPRWMRRRKECVGPGNALTDVL